MTYDAHITHVYKWSVVTTTGRLFMLIVLQSHDQCIIILCKIHIHNILLNIFL